MFHAAKIPSCKYLEGCLEENNEIIAQNVGSRMTFLYEMEHLITWAAAVWKMREAKNPKNLFNHFMVVYITLGHDHNMSDSHLVFLKDATVYKSYC